MRVLSVAFMVAFSECVSAAPATVGAALPRVGGGPTASTPGGRLRLSVASAGHRLRGAVSRTIAAAVLAAALPFGLAADPSAATLGATWADRFGTALSWIEAEAQPCAALCDARWALDRMQTVMPRGVHGELAQRIAAGRPMRRTEVAAGDVIVAVSYARAGVPLVNLTRRVAPEGVQHPAAGHAVQHEGLEYRFVRLDTWGNWALVIDVAKPVDLHGPNGDPISIAIAGAGSGAGGGAGGGLGGGGGGLGWGGSGLASLEADPTDPDALLRLPPPPTAVPLPGGFALLAGAAVLLAGLRRRATAPRR